jgi:hypothetical protein
MACAFTQVPVWFSRARPCLSFLATHTLPSQVLLSDMYQYTVREADRGRALYLSSSDASRCALGQAQILNSTPYSDIICKCTDF